MGNFAYLKEDENVQLHGTTNLIKAEEPLILTYSTVLLWGNQILLCLEY